MASLLLLASSASAEPESGWYRGLIGPTATDCDTPERYQENDEIEMVLRVVGDHVTGSYFFTNLDDVVSLEIPIEGRIVADGSLELTDEGDARHPAGRWRGILDVDLHGTWTDRTGKKRAFFLTPLPKDEEPEREIAPGIAIRGQRVVGTNLVLPFLTRHPSPDVMRRINDRIRSSFAGHRCPPDQPFPAWPDDYGVDWEVTHASPALWSVSVTEGWFCGAAYPNDQDDSFTFDLETGEEISFEALFRDWEKDRAAILELLFADALRNAGEECQEAAAADPADTDLAPGPRFFGGVFAYHLASTSLSVKEQGLMHAFRACAVLAEVPYEELRQYAAPGGAIERVLAGTPAGAP